MHKITGSRESRDNISSSVISAPTSPVEQTPLKLSANIGRNPLRGSKCNFFISFLIFLIPFYYNFIDMVGCSEINGLMIIEKNLKMGSIFLVRILEFLPSFRYQNSPTCSRFV
jgi:hypothetical protein